MKGETKVNDKTLDNLYTLIEMLKAEIGDAIDKQETEMREEYYKGVEYEAKYCLEMIKKIFGAE